jgi:hypothetical protein
VAWTSYGQDGSSTGVYAQRYNAAGVPQGTEFRVNTYTTNSQWSPSVAMDADGDFVVAWQGRGVGDSLGIFAQRYSAAGVPQGAEFRVNTRTTSDELLSSVAMDADGDFVVAWQSRQGIASDWGIYAQLYNAAGTPRGPEFRVYADGALASAAMDADGDFVVTWMSHGQDGSDWGIYAQRYNAPGVPQGGEFRVNTYTSGPQMNPSVSMEADGDFVVTWMSYEPDGSRFGICAQRYRSAGVPQAGEFKVNTYTTDGQAYPKSAMDADGDLVIVWQSDGQDGSEEGVYAQRLTHVPTVSMSAFLFNTTPHRVQFTFDENVSASLGTEDFLVENLTTGQTIPAADFAISYDLSTNIATFTYTGSAGGIAGVLPDGNYRATLLAAGVHTPNGNTLPADHVLNFHFLRGDANGDGTVNLQDFNILATNFGKSPRDFTQGDFNYDSFVNLQDVNILAIHFGTVLGPAWPPRG